MKEKIVGTQGPKSDSSALNCSKIRNPQNLINSRKTPSTIASPHGGTDWLSAALTPYVEAQRVYFRM